MNGTSLHPLNVADALAGASVLVADVVVAADELAQLYSAEREAYYALQEATAVFDDLVDAAIVQYDFEANSLKEGPLANIARTSDAYKLKVKGLRQELAKGEFQVQYRVMMIAEGVHQRASIEYEKAKIRLGALKSVAELQSSLLRALAG